MFTVRSTYKLVVESEWDEESMAGSNARMDNNQPDHGEIW
jgi:hypothetical protein